MTQFTAEDLLIEMADAGVDGAILHPPSWDPDCNEVALQAALDYPNRFAVLGNFPLDDPRSRQLLVDWRAQPGRLGLRFPLIRPNEQNWHSDGTMDWLWPAAESAGVPVALLAWRFLPKLKAIAEAHPDLRLIIDHLGVVRTARDAAIFDNMAVLTSLAKLPNVAIKAIGVAGYSTEAYPYPKLHEGLKRIFDAFGPRRFFWGTDMTRMPCSYRQCVTLFTEELPWLERPDLDLVMGQGICNWIGFEGPAVASAIEVDSGVSAITRALENGG